MWPTTTFVNYICSVKTAQQFQRLGITIIVIFTHASCEPAQNNSCDCVPKGAWKQIMCNYIVTVSTSKQRPIHLVLRQCFGNSQMHSAVAVTLSVSSTFTCAPTHKKKGLSLK